MGKARVLAAMFAALLVPVLLAGCGSAASSSASSSAAGASSAASASAASASAAGEGASASAEAGEASAASSADAQAQLAPGVYSAKFDTDSSMFHINEADEGRGVLTVDADGMTIHIHLVSKKIVKLYSGTAEQAEADEAGAIQPSTDTVTYKDGYEEEVYGFDVPVPAIGEEFDVAILGEKGTWYDHKVSVSDPVEE